MEVESGGINVVTWSGIEWDTVYTEWDLYLKNKKKLLLFVDTFNRRKHVKSIVLRLPSVLSAACLAAQAARIYPRLPVQPLHL